MWKGGARVDRVKEEEISKINVENSIKLQEKNQNVDLKENKKHSGSEKDLPFPCDKYEKSDLGNLPWWSIEEGRTLHLCQQLWIVCCILIGFEEINWVNGL